MINIITLHNIIKKIDYIKLINKIKNIYYNEILINYLLKIQKKIKCINYKLVTDFYYNYYLLSFDIIFNKNNYEFIQNKLEKYIDYLLYNNNIFDNYNIGYPGENYKVKYDCHFFI